MKSQNEEPIHWSLMEQLNDVELNVSHLEGRQRPYDTMLFNLNS